MLSGYRHLLNQLGDLGWPLPYNRFEILLSGNHVNELNTNTVLFAPPSDATVLTTPQPITSVNLAGSDEAKPCMATGATIPLPVVPETTPSTVTLATTC